MQTGAKREREPLSLGIGPATPPADSCSSSEMVSESLPGASAAIREDSLVEFSPLGRLPRLDLGIEWGSQWREFGSSVGTFFSGPRAPGESELPDDSDLRVHWIEGKNSPWAFMASSLWHVAAVLVAVLPIWGFLPATAHNLAPVQIDVSWAAPQDLPPIHLQSPTLPPPKPEERKPTIPKIAEDLQPAPDGADAFHPRQTILSIPVRITHPRQTLIEPDAPMTPPKVDPQLPNVVQWAASAQAPQLQLQLAPSTAAPKARERKPDTAVAPDVANAEKPPGPLNIASSPMVNPTPQMPVAPMSAGAARFRDKRIGSAAAPEVNGASGDASLRNVIALSASPAPPAPVVALPEGNLAARVAISPAGKRPGAPNGGAAGAGHRASVGSVAGGGSLPASVSISGGAASATAAGGGIAANRAPTKLILRPMNSLPEPPARVIPRGPADVAALSPNAPPEALFSGKEVHTLNINLPNVTSISGSWILNFAQLNETASPFNKPEGTLYGPVPIRKVDPKYPAEAVRQNIQGEVVLYAIIRASGSVDSIQVVRHLDAQLDRDAVEALAQWKFHPATRDGKAVDVEAVVHIPFQYKLQEQ